MSFLANNVVISIHNFVCICFVPQDNEFEFTVEEFDAGDETVAVGLF